MTCRWSPPLRRAELALAAAFALGSSAAAHAGEEETAAARALYEKGLKHYNLAEYPEAIALFREAYHSSDAPEFLFNIAQAYRLRGDHCTQALQFYRSYLRVAPESSKRKSVEAAMIDMERCAAAEPKSSTTAVVLTTAAVVPEAVVPEAELRWWPLALGGAG